MANKYSEGKIYKITAGDECYIGSTTWTKEKRFEYHIYNYASWLKGKTNFTSSYKLFQKYGIDSCKIDIIEYYPCNSKQELERQEGFHQRNEICVNTNIAGRTDKEYRDETKEQQKQWREDNKEKIKEHKKQDYELNKEQQHIKNKITEVCECGSTFTTVNKARHLKTKKHLEYISSLK